MRKMMPQFPIGIDNFHELVTQDYFFAINEPSTKKIFHGLKISTFDQGALVKKYQANIRLF